MNLVFEIKLILIIWFFAITIYLSLSNLFILRYSCLSITIKLVADLLMAWKASLRKSKYGKGPNAVSETTDGIAAGNHEDCDFERLVQIMQTPDQAVFGIMEGDHIWLGNHERDNDRKCELSFAMAFWQQ